MIKYDKPPGTLVRDFKESMADGNEAAVNLYHKEFVPGHFTQGAGRRYGYQKRQGSGEGPYVQKTYIDHRYRPPRQVTRMVKNQGYIWRKFREKGHMLDLIYTGESKAEAVGGLFRVSAKNNEARGDFLSLPRYFYKYRKDMGRLQPDKAAELVSYTNDEAEKMARVAQDVAVSKLNNES